MTSYVGMHHTLSRQTAEAFGRCAVTHSIQDRLALYLSYFEDVAPFGITVHHIPSSEQHSSREEIQLVDLSSGRLFMSGLVSMERNPSWLERVAGDEAYGEYMDRSFVSFGHKWRFFTGLKKLRIYEGDDDSWDPVDEFDLLREPQEVASFLQEEYYKISGRL